MQKPWSLFPGLSKCNPIFFWNMQAAIGSKRCPFRLLWNSYLAFVHLEVFQQDKRKSLGEKSELKCERNLSPVKGIINQIENSQSAFQNGKRPTELPHLFSRISDVVGCLFKKILTLPSGVGYRKIKNLYIKSNPLKFVHADLKGAIFKSKSLLECGSF